MSRYLDTSTKTQIDLHLLKYGERNEKSSQQDRLSKFCMVAGFLNVVEIGQYFMTKTEDAPKLLKIPKSECPDIWIRLPRHKWPKSGSSMEDPVVPLERNLYGHPLEDCYGKGNLRKSH